MPDAAPVAAVDPFDLPEWLGEREVTWTALTAVRGEHRVRGRLSGSGDDAPLGCDLLAADVAYPQPVLAEQWRREVHAAWSLGQVLLLETDGRLVLAVPGTGFTADLVLETLGRLAKALGVEPDRFVATLRL